MDVPTPVGNGGDVVTVTQTSTSTFSPVNTPTQAPATIPSTTSSPSASATASSTAIAQASSGLSKSGTIAIAVVVPIAVLALLAILAFIFWRRNRDKKARLAARKGEIEDYGFDPNAPDATGGGVGSSAAPIGALGGAALGGAAVTGASSEMRQTYGEDEGDGYRGWGPTSSTNTRSSRLPLGAAAVAGGAAGVGAGAYYAHQRGNSNGAYDPYSTQSPDDYYYPEENNHQGPTSAPNIPPKSYERYDPAVAGGFAGAAGTGTEEYHEQAGQPLGVVNADVQRNPSNASSRYSTNSTDENAGRSYQNSPQFQQGFQNPAGSVGRPGRSTMGGSYDDQQGGRYDAVNF